MDGMMSKCKRCGNPLYVDKKEIEYRLGGICRGCLTESELNEVLLWSAEQEGGKK